MLSLNIMIISVAVSVASSAAALLALRLWISRRSRKVGPRSRLDEDDGTVFIFDGRTLVDATPKARVQLPQEPANSDDWCRFVVAFSYRFEGLEKVIGELGPGQHARITEVADDPDSLQLVATEIDGLTRIALIDPRRQQRSELVEHYSLAAMRAELLTLRTIAEQSPAPTWKQRTDGTIIWANTAYVALARDLVGEESLFGWPPPDVFADVTVARSESGGLQRVSIGIEDSPRRLWFDLTSVPGEIETLYFAAPVDKLVRAENALSEFVQTLTKTFAHLTIGLAIFDKKRQLALFNPALVDLTGLPPEQLSCRPNLHTFLDALRDRQRIPEPKDYKSWRLHIAQLEAGAANGTYEEVWHLPSGQTYRVSGRPHPNGAVAYVFEDISSEVSMTRSFRSEIEMSQSVMDGLDIAVAAFSSDGILTLSNRAYAQLWESNAATRLTETTITDAARGWESQCRQDESWEQFRRTLKQSRNRPTWSGPIRRLDDTTLRCEIRPLSRGATLVSFVPVKEERANQAPLRIEHADQVVS